MILHKYEDLLKALENRQMLPVAVAEATCPENPEQIIPKLLELGVSSLALTTVLAEIFAYQVYDPEKHGAFSCANLDAGWGYAQGIFFVTSPFNTSLQPIAVLPREASDNLRGFGLLPATDKNMADERQVYGQARAENIIEEWIREAVAAGATDIHIAPLTPKYIRVRMRADGQLRTVEEFESDSGDCNYDYISNLLLRLANSNSGSFVRPVDGSFEKILAGMKVEVRLAMRPVTVEGVFSRAFYLRLLYSRKNMSANSLTTLGFSQDFLNGLAVTRRLNQGLALITGPTGSGKTTTLYACLTEIIKDDPWRSVQTLEEPIEKNIRGAEQTQINEQAGMGFQTGLKALMRSDVDVILIGEIRDPETARLAVRACYTGHLVFATLHAMDAVFTVERLRDFGISSKSVSSVLTAVIAQRLLRKVCSHCAYSLPWQKHPYRHICQEALSPQEVIKHANTKGCENCERGYHRRQVVTEILFPDRVLLDAIANDSTVSELADLVARQGHKTLWDAAVVQIRNGTTTPDECARNLPHFYPQTFKNTSHNQGTNHAR